MAENKELKRKKVFISYSWKQKKWAIDFATKLRGIYGIDVVIDEWDLKAGTNKYTFMESEVNDPNIDKVLMICDKTYADKANTREGGVGDETNILTPEVYNATSPGKYIPIVIERNEEGEPYLPTYLKPQMYVDFSNLDAEVASYEKLVFEIYGENQITKPDLAELPTQLLNHEVNDFPARQLITKMKSTVNEKRVADLFNDQFVPELLTLVAEYEIVIDKSQSLTRENQFKLVDEKINSSMKLNGVFKEGLSAYITYASIDGETLAQYFSSLNKMCGRNDQSDWEKEAIKFILYEQFLTTVGELIEHKKWDALKYLVLAKYKDRSNNKFYYLALRHPPYTIYDHNDRQQLRYEDPIARMIMMRNSENFNKMVCADLLLYYISQLRTNYTSQLITNTWYPSLMSEVHSTVWGGGTGVDFPLLENLDIGNNLHVLLNLTDLDKETFLSHEAYKIGGVVDHIQIPAIRQFQEVL